jgi:predicted 3-demethylubiquinone-9 3-methyltransferase (glyoxalase superfamily)
MSKIQKIMPCLWFDREAEEAAKFYTSLFKDSKIGRVLYYGKEGHEIHGMPEGTVLTVEFEINGQAFTALNGGPVFTFTPAISFFVNCETEQELDELWRKLSQGGTVLMELNKYPFSEKFGWLNDKFGLSWQLNLEGSKQKITPFLMFVGEQHGKAEGAMNFYISMFKNSGVTSITRYGKNEEEAMGTVKHSIFTLESQEFMAIDSAFKHDFTFNEAISFIVNCETQEEVDSLWDKLSEGGDEKAQQCGWLKDKYGVSWQVVPTILDELLADTDKKKAGKVMEALLKMKKLDIAKLKEAYNGK